MKKNYPDLNSPVARLALRTATKFKDDYIRLSKEIFYSSSSKNGLHHAGEFGRYREQLLKSFLESFLPNRLAIGDGFVASPNGSLSTQSDAIIHDRNASPKLITEGGLVMFPIEVCVAVGEVKSILSFGDLQVALNKLLITKQMRAEMEVVTFPIAPVEAVIDANTELQNFMASNANSRNQMDAARNMYRPHEREQQNLITFIVCEEIAWPKGSPPSYSFNSLYNNKCDLHLRHNFILSLKQGFLSYYFCRPDGEEFRNTPYPYPVQSFHKPVGVDDDVPTACGWRWLEADPNNHHIMTFASELTHAAGRVPVYQFDPKMHSLDPVGFDFDYEPFG